MRLVRSSCPFRRVCPTSSVRRALALLMLALAACDPAGAASPPGSAAGSAGSESGAGQGGESGAAGAGQGSESGAGGSGGAGQGGEPAGGAGAGGAGVSGGSGQGGAGHGSSPPGLPALSAEALAALDGASHLLVVVTGEWSATPATLGVHVRSGGGWERAAGPYEAVVGSKGLSWGRGLTEPPEGATRVKKEGDKTAPAGLFRLGTAMGYAAAAPGGLTLPYQQAKTGLVCVDDAKAAQYNTLQMTPAQGPAGWNSSEPMLRPDGFYELLALVDHNRLVEGQGAVAGGGSCIFLHVWGGPGSSTAGCTALDREQLTATLVALPSLDNTLMIQLPQAEYDQLIDPWGLPAAP